MDWGGVDLVPGQGRLEAFSCDMYWRDCRRRGLSCYPYERPYFTEAAPPVTECLYE